MTGKDILDKIFDVTFKEGNYANQIKPLDAQGMVGRSQTITIIMSLLEELDSLEERVKKLENENITHRTGQNPNKPL